jgi:hypothetical protein
MTYNIETLEQLITVATEQRKRARELKLTLLVKSLNYDLRTWKYELATLKLENN